MWGIVCYIEHVVCILIGLVVYGILQRAGLRELLRIFVVTAKQIPGVAGLLESHLNSEATSFIKTTKLASEKKPGGPLQICIPNQGFSKEELLEKLSAIKEKEVNHLEGKTFAYTYTLRDTHYDLQKEAFDMFTDKIGYSTDVDNFVKFWQTAFLHENALNPMIYPGLRKMETEIVSMTCAMLNGDSNCVGFLTSGGTESILMAVKSYRDRARKLYPWIKEPEIISPMTQHPVMDKAAHYFGLTIKHVKVKDDFRADVNALEEAIGPNTILITCSAPQFCHGIVDPVQEISDMAMRHGLPVHVDACFGGFMLPWVEKLGYQVPTWDFRCAGVTSISADIHKYGYCVKGASVVAYRGEEYRKHQIFTYGSWPGGLYGSPSMAGTRPGNNIAAAWCSMNFLGVEGYLRKAKILMEITDKMKNGVQKIEGVKVIGNPHMTCFAVGSDHPDIDIMAVADLMEKKGWTIERNQKPNSMHCSILPHHEVSCDDFVSGLEESVKEAKGNKKLSKEGTAGMYGMMATIPDSAIVDDFIKEFFAEVYKLQ